MCAPLRTSRVARHASGSRKASLEANRGELAREVSDLLLQLDKLSVTVDAVLQGGLEVLQLGTRLGLEVLRDGHGAVEEDTDLLKVLLREATTHSRQKALHACS